MKEIQMVDLVTQFENREKEFTNAIINVVKSGAFINGPEVKLFQKELEEYLNVKHVIPCANGTDAIQIALMALGLKPGDEVITTTFTFIATAEVIGLLQLKPVLVDCEPDTFNISVAGIKKAITPKSKAIIPVHLYGQCSNMEAILEVATANNLFVVEDTAQAIGADYTFSNGTKAKAGTMGDFGTTSFFPSKNLGCYGDGGALFTNNDALAEQARMIANHGSKIKYYHEVVGVNSRLDAIQAAILRIKLRDLDKYAAARNKVANAYKQAFADTDKITTPVKSEYSTHVFHQYTVKLNGVNRETLRSKLAEKGVPAMIYYPVPLHLQTAYQEYGYKTGDFTVAEQLAECVISLPIHTEMQEEQLNHIINSVLESI
jgi:dTDP-4-amino-4,6-dideoxygalactose transaminase